MHTRLLLAVIFVATVATGKLQAAAPTAVDTAASAAVAVSRRVGNDQFVAAGNVRVSQAVAGDLVAAGGTVDVDAAVAGDALLLGGTVRLGSGVGHSVYAAAGKLSVHGPVGRNLRVAGGQVELLEEAEVAGNVSVGAGRVTLRGPVRGELRVGGGTVLIDGPVQGDVWVSAGELQLGPNARLQGNLHWRGNKDMQTDPAAQIMGTVEQLPWPGDKAQARRHRDEMQMGAGHPSWRHRSSLTGGWWWNLGLMVLAAVLVAAAPSFAQNVSSTLRTRWPASLLAGVVALVCIPATALLLLITLIGAPLAVVVMLLYVPLLIVGYVSFGAAMGQWALARWRAAAPSTPLARVVAAMLAVALLALLASVPVLGALVALVAVISGVGMLVLQALPRHTQPSAA
jgi:cytoskeletal protein CcmA (bactofilin family)